MISKPKWFFQQALSNAFGLDQLKAISITKVFLEIHYPPIPNKMVALRTGREVTNQVENKKGVSLILWWGWNQCSSIKGDLSPPEGGQKKNMLCS